MIHKGAYISGGQSLPFRPPAGRQDSTTLPITQHVPALPVNFRRIYAEGRMVASLLGGGHEDRLPPPLPPDREEIIL